jgi:hypothetical protein
MHFLVRVLGCVATTRSMWRLEVVIMMLGFHYAKKMSQIMMKNSCGPLARLVPRDSKASGPSLIAGAHVEYASKTPSGYF